MGMPELKIYSMIGAEGFARLVAAFYLTRPHTAQSARFRASHRSVPLLHPDIFFLSPPRLTSAINSSSHRCAGCYSSGLGHSR